MSGGEVTSGTSRRCPSCRRKMADHLGGNLCDRCVEEKGVRRCERCRGKLSRWNRGKFCNPCWSSMSLKQREKFAGKHGYMLEAYDPKKDLMREQRLDEIAREPLEVSEAKRARKNAQRKVNLRKQAAREKGEPYPVDTEDDVA